MMKVAVIADTHIPIAAKSIPSKVIEGIKDVDLILHAGDLVEIDVLKKLENIKPVIAVAGNMDSQDLKKILHEKKVLHLEGFKIGLIHGFGPPDALLDLVKEEFSKIKNLACVIYAHSHIPSIKTVDGIIYFNPGSPTDKTFAPYNSYGMLEIQDKIVPRIVKIS